MSRRTNHHFEELDDEDDGFDDVVSLRSKVKLLKTVSTITISLLTFITKSIPITSPGSRYLKVSIQIGEETREHNRFLKNLDNEAESVFGSLSLNMDKVKKLSMAGHNRLVFFLLAFALFVVIVIYFINKS